MVKYLKNQVLQFFFHQMMANMGAGGGGGGGESEVRQIGRTLYCVATITQRL